MALTTLSAGQVIRAAPLNANFALCVLTDTSKTISVTHTYTASQTFTGGFTTGAASTFGAVMYVLMSSATANASSATTCGQFVGPASSDASVVLDAVGGSADYYVRRMNGTSAVPTAVLTTQGIGKLIVKGYDGSAFVNAGYLSWTSTENWGANRGSQLAITTCLTGAAEVSNRVVFGGAGLATFSHGITIAGALAGVTTAAVSGLITSTATTGMIASATATATPSAYSATQCTVLASTVSGGVLMGFGTTFDVTLKNRAGTDVLGIGPNTTTVTTAGALVITGALSGVTTIATSSTINSQTISATASFTGTVTAATSITSTAGDITATNGDIKLGTNNKFYYGKLNSGTSTRILGMDTTTFYVGPIDEAVSGSVLLINGAANLLTFNTTGTTATFLGSLTTGAPSGGTAGAWKMGVAASVSPTSPNRTIELDVGGTIYYIHAKTTNN